MKRVPAPPKDQQEKNCKHCGKPFGRTTRESWKNFLTRIFCSRLCSARANTGTRTHRRTRTPEYRAWINMRRRCHDPKERYFSRYGGRGITVCERWQVFESFFADVGERPGPEYSLDRVNNDGNYEPGNCRWATGSQQQRNTSRSRLLTVDGVTKTTAEWAEITGLSKATIAYRYHNGCDDSKLLAPVKEEFRRG